MSMKHFIIAYCLYFIYHYFFIQMEKKNFPAQNKEDASSLANFHQIKQLIYEAELYINFSKQSLQGYTIIKFEIVDSSAKSVVLDCKDIVVSKVFLQAKNDDSEVVSVLEDSELQFTLHQDHPSKESLGTPLEIFLPSNYNSKFLDVKIYYETKHESNGLQWLDKSQTYSQKYPYVFTQCEAILARTCIPCQDSPSVKVLFKKVDLIIESGINALFGGELLKKSDLTFDGKACTKFEYTQKVIIPTYLFAIAAGDIHFKKISPRCGVYAEEHLLEKAVEEFKDIEVYLKAAEDYLDYKYVWGNYDVLFLPQAFPYGGMENPNLTFLNNALLVGDKSMVGTIAHEIAHSWTGNLVTNKNWDNFWVNEGFTVFMERKLMEIVKGKEIATLEADVGYDEFLYAVKIQGETHKYTCLEPKFQDEDPDDGFSVVPYEKGFNLLYYIEKLIGEELFRDILRIYIKTYAYKSIDYFAYKNILEEQLKLHGRSDVISKIDWYAWVEKPGFLPIEVNFKTKSAEEATLLFEDIIKGKFDENNFETAALTFNKFDTFVKVVFLNLFINKIDQLNDKNYSILSKITNLNKVECNNPEIMYTWLQVALRKKDEEAVEPTKQFLLKQGRMKYIKPVFIVFYKFKGIECREFFNQYRHLWHSVPTRLIQGEFERIDKSN